MLKDYKGEKPQNVITQEEHQKRPFFKKASFWILSALGLFFGACSIYGLVLGYQYVDAVREAAHIIADATSEQEDSLKPTPKMIGNRHDSVAFECWPSQTGYFGLDGTAIEWGNPAPYFNLGLDSSLNKYYLRLTWAGYYQVPLFDYITDSLFETYEHSGYTVDSSYSNGLGRIVFDYVGLPMHFKGVFHYDPYRSGYQTGYSSGYDTGYAEAQNPTTIHLSVAPEYYPQTGSFHYEWFVDNTLQTSGDLYYQGSNGWDSVELYRNAGSTARLVFDRPGTQFITEYSISAFGDDGGYPALNDTNAYNFDDAIWYVPSYYEDFYLRAQGGSAPADHYSDTYDIYLDPDHNERAHIGLWDDGYRQGYADGMADNGRWQQGWNTGYKTGKDEGYINGYQKGVHDTSSGSKALLNMFVTAFQQPFDQVYRFLNFNLLGINFLSLFTALLTLGIGIIVIKKVL